MKKLIIAAAVLAACVISAEAKCSKKALNGNWALAAEGEVVAIGTASGGTFTFNIGGTPFVLTLTGFSSSTCKGSGIGTEGGFPFNFKMASESIPGSSQKPNQLLVTADVGAGLIPLALKRQ